MFKMMGFGQITSLEAWTIALTAIAIALLVGWIIDLVSERIGFGVFGNAVVCLVALGVSLIAFRHYLGEISVARLPLVMGCATLSVMVHMCGLIYFRRVTRL
jgi:hypothetical protein